MIDTAGKEEQLNRSIHSFSESLWRISLVPGAGRAGDTHESQSPPGFSHAELSKVVAGTRDLCWERSASETLPGGGA